MKPKTLLLAFLAIYTVVLLSQAISRPLEWDEGQNLITAAFLSDFTKWWLENPTTSPDEIISFALDFNLHNKGAYLFFCISLLPRLLTLPFLLFLNPTYLTYRLAPIIAAILGIVGMFLLSKKLGLSEKSAAYTSLLLALIPIYFNQSSNNQTHIFAAALIIWAVLSYISKDHKKFLLLSVLAFHARYTTGIIWAVVLLDTVLHERKSLPARLKEFGIYLIFTLPWFLIMQLQPFSPKILTSTYFGKIFFQQVNLSTYFSYLQFLPIYVMPLLLLLAFFSIRKPTRWTKFILLFAVGNALLYSLIDPQHGISIHAFHYMLPSLVFIPLLAEMTISRLKNPNVANYILTIASAAFLISTLAPTSPISPSSLSWGGVANADREQIAWAALNSNNNGIIISNPSQTLAFRSIGAAPYLFQYPYGQDLEEFTSGGWKEKYPDYNVPNITFTFLLWDRWLDGSVELPDDKPIFEKPNYKAYLLGRNPK